MSITAPTKPERTFPDYRRALRQALPEQYFRPDGSHALWLLPHAVLIGVCLWLLSAHFSWWYAPFLSVVIAHSFGCMGFVAHDICHGGGIKNGRLRHLLAGFGFSPFWIGPHLWSQWHNADHHNNTQIEGVDPDHLFTIEVYENSRLLKAFTKLNPVVRNFVVFGSFCFRMSQHNLIMALRYLRSEKTPPRGKLIIASQFAVPLAAWVGLTALLGWQALLFGYAIPLILANFLVICYIATNHFLNPLADDRDVLATSLSVTLPRPLWWLDVLHSRFGAHVAHHLFPQVPAKYARAIEDKIAELWPDRFHRMPIGKALRLLWITPWLYEEKKTLVDPHRQVRMPTLGHGLATGKPKRQTEPV